MALKAGVLLDTHAWLWLRFGTLSASPTITAELREAAEHDRWFISSFAFFEIAHAVQRKRLHLDRPLLDWLRLSSVPGAPAALQLTPEVAAASVGLPSTFHGDPGDRILAATAIVYDLTLCTHDQAMLRFAKQGLFRAIKVDEKKEKHAR